MVNTIVWCMITVNLFSKGEETAVKGKVIKENDKVYFVDFSEYARQQRYEGAYYYYAVDKDKCIKEDL